jgi:DNA-binding transcriptional ArsR family regulator
MQQHNTGKQIRQKARTFNALSDPIRLDILEFLRTGEKCVCEIVPRLGLIQPLVSRHLKILKEAGMVRCRREGTKRMYSIVDAKVYNVIDALTPDIVNALTKEVLENATCP